MPLRVGVDIVFLDGAEGPERLNELYGTTRPLSTVVLDKVCGNDDTLDTCSAQILETAARTILSRLHGFQ